MKAAVETTLARPEVLAHLSQVDTLLLDVDGVLVDVNESIHRVGAAAVEFYLTSFLGWPPGEYLTAQEVERFKLTSGFNDDWDLAQVAVLLLLVKAELDGRREPAALRAARPTVEEICRLLGQGGPVGARALLLSMVAGEARDNVLSGFDGDRVVRVFRELYAGPLCRRFYGFDPEYHRGQGLIGNDRLLVDAGKLRASTARLGLYTGRMLEEARFALELGGLQDLFPREAVIVLEDGVLKPDPAGLRLLVERLGSRAALFVGDMPDDLEAVRRYSARREPGDPVVASCVVLTGPMQEQQALDWGADLVASDVNAVLELLEDDR